MSDQTTPFVGDLLSGLAANPDLLKNAMQMASALASSGVLSGLFGNTPPGESSSPPQPPPTSSPQVGGAGSATGGFADLLAGIMGQTAGGAASNTGSATTANAQSVPASAGGENARPQPSGKRPPSPSHHDRVHLLQSICPFLPEDKREKVQFLIKLLGLLSAAEEMGLGTGKLF